MTGFLVAWVAMASAQDEYGATAEVERDEPGEIDVESDELEELPALMGDPLRLPETLPGTTLVQSGTPFIAVRGAPPSSTLYYYDDIPLPAIAHLAAGPALLHPAVVGRIEFSPAAAPARYGRHTGAVLAATAAEPSAEAMGEAELRLLDLNGMVDVPIEDHRLQAATHIGYPGLLLSLTSPGAKLAYFDYLARYSHRFGDDTVEAIALGSFDSVENPPWAPNDGAASVLDMQFHRLELRFRRERRDWELGAALRFGADDSVLGTDFAVTALSIAPRIWTRWRSERVRVRAGADLVGSSGDVSDPDGVLAGFLGSAAIDLPIYAEAGAREAFGLYTELELRPEDELRIEAGLRGDLWITAGSDVELAPSPRLRITYSPVEEASLHLGGALVYQPAVYAFPVPGLSEVSIDRGLQRGIQSELGVSFALPEDVSIEAQAFFNRYDDLLLVEDIWNQRLPECDGTRCDAPARTAINAYGAELFVRRSSRSGLSGWLAYTLSWSDAERADGTTFTPKMDVRHVLNVVASYALDFGLHVGVRALLRSGFMGAAPLWNGAAITRHEQRLSPFFRLDARIGYEWEVSYGSWDVYAEFLNVTIADEPFDLVCDAATGAESCRETSSTAIWAPNAGIRATFR
jgi:hypothetical protein